MLLQPQGHFCWTASKGWHHLPILSNTTAHLLFFWGLSASYTVDVLDAASDINFVSKSHIYNILWQVLASHYSLLSWIPALHPLRTTLHPLCTYCTSVYPTNLEATSVARSHTQSARSLSRTCVRRVWLRDQHKPQINLCLAKPGGRVWCHTDFS